MTLSQSSWGVPGSHGLPASAQNNVATKGQPWSDFGKLPSFAQRVSSTSRLRPAVPRFEYTIHRVLVVRVIRMIWRLFPLCTRKPTQYKLLSLPPHAPSLKSKTRNGCYIRIAFSFSFLELPLDACTLQLLQSHLVPDKPLPMRDTDLR